MRMSRVCFFFLAQVCPDDTCLTVDTDSAREFDDVSAAGIHSIPFRDPSPA